MPKVDPESGEPMSDDPDGPQDQAGGATPDPGDQRKPDDDYAGSAS